MSVQQIKETALDAKIKLLEWRMAVCWFVLFTIGSLCTAMVASLVNADWGAMNNQSKFLMVLAIVGSWCNTMMAFFSKAAKKVDQQINGDGGTQIFTRSRSESESVAISPKKPASEDPKSD